MDSQLGPYVAKLQADLEWQQRSLVAVIMDNLVVKAANFSTDFPAIQHIRSRVFQIEQGVAADLEFDGNDATATHLLATLDGQPVGTARLRILDAHTAKIERVAVLTTARGRGIGKQLMVEALDWLTTANITVARIHAQVAVQTFYEQLGFEPEGDIFDEAGIAHIKMQKWLTRP